MGWLGSILVRVKNAYDWATLADALWKAVESKLGISVVSTLIAALAGGYAEATGYQIALMGVGTFVGLNAFFILREIKKPRPAFKIQYDESNPNSKYWSLENWSNAWSPVVKHGMEYRIGIYNDTSATLVDVSATIEGIGGDWYPSQLRFLPWQDEVYEIDIHPRSTEYAIVFMIPPANEENAPPIRDVIIRIKAKDTSEVSEQFKLDHHRVPALYRG